jgi:hypothetical protein
MSTKHPNWILCALNINTNWSPYAIDFVIKEHVPELINDLVAALWIEVHVYRV